MKNQNSNNISNLPRTVRIRPESGTLEIIIGNNTSNVATSTTNINSGSTNNLNSNQVPNFISSNNYRLIF